MLRNGSAFSVARALSPLEDYPTCSELHVGTESFVVFILTDVGSVDADDIADSVDRRQLLLVLRKERNHHVAVEHVRSRAVSVTFVSPLLLLEVERLVDDPDHLPEGGFHPMRGLSIDDYSVKVVQGDGAECSLGQRSVLIYPRYLLLIFLGRLLDALAIWIDPQSLLLLGLVLGSLGPSSFLWFHFKICTESR